MKPIQFPDIDLGDLMEVICNYRAETYKYERHIALRTFSAWVLWPNQLGIINQAKIVSAALTIRMIRSDAFNLPGRERAQGSPTWLHRECAGFFRGSAKQETRQ